MLYELYWRFLRLAYIPEVYRVMFTSFSNVFLLRQTRIDDLLWKKRTTKFQHIHK